MQRARPPLQNPGANLGHRYSRFTIAEVPREDMLAAMDEASVKSLDDPEHSWTFPDGSKRSVVVLQSVAIGRGRYLPGWRWSVHVGKPAGKSSKHHIGYVVSGLMAVRGADGREIRVGPGGAFEVGPGHDAWVEGNEPCVALDFEYLK